MKFSANSPLKIVGFRLCNTEVASTSYWAYLIRGTGSWPSRGGHMVANEAADLRSAALGRELTLHAFIKREQEVRRDFWAKLRRFASRLPFVEDLVAAYFCAL